jgi:hypothetical protein
VSGSGQPSLVDLDGTGLRVAIAASRWHDRVMGGLIAGAQRGLDASRVDPATVVRAAGCFELPVVVQALAGEGYDAVVALGVVSFAFVSGWVPIVVIGLVAMSATVLTLWLPRWMPARRL